METEARAIGDALSQLESNAELKDALLRGATALRVLARTSTIPTFDWAMTAKQKDDLQAETDILRTDAQILEDCANLMEVE